MLLYMYSCFLSALSHQSVWCSHEMRHLCTTSKIRPDTLHCHEYVDSHVFPTVESGDTGCGDTLLVGLWEMLLVMKHDVSISPPSVHVSDEG